METSKAELSREGLWKWHFGLTSIVLFVLGVAHILPWDRPVSKPLIFEVPIDYNPRVPKLLGELSSCIHSCLVPRIAQLGCAYPDYACYCRNLHLLDEYDCVASTTRGISFEACARQCDAHQGFDLLRSPSLILDLCEELDEPVVLPAFMDGIIKLYGRQFMFSSSVVPLQTPTVPLQTPTITQTLPWGVIPTSFPSTSFDGSEYIVFATDTSISTFFSTTTLPQGAAAYTSVVTAQDSPAITRIIGVTAHGSPIGTNSIGATQKSTNTANSGAGATDIITAPTSGPKTGLSSGAKAGIGGGIALVVILLALGFAWFYIVHRRKIRRRRSEVDREKNNGANPEHISNLIELGSNSKSPGRKYQNPDGVVPQDLNGTQMHISPNELPAVSSMANQRHELQDFGPTSQRSELGPGDRSQVQDFPERGLQTSIQRKAVSPGFTPFPPPWATDTHQGNDGRAENHGEGQSEEVAHDMIIEPDEHDPELQRLEQEIAKVKAERERLQRLHDLESREEDLKKIIEKRRRGPGGQSSA